MQKTVLDNGVTVVTRRFNELGSAYIHWRLTGGSSAEPPGYHGGMHFLEHVLCDRDRLMGKIERRGEEFNACTSKTALDMFAHVWPSHAEDTFKLLLADGLAQPRFSASTYNKERARIVGEMIDASNDTNAVLYDGAQARMYADGSRSHSVLGTPEEFNLLTLEKLRELHAQSTCGHNLIVAAAGDVHHDKVVRQVERHVRHLPHGPSPALGAANTFSPGGLGICHESAAGVELMVTYHQPTDAQARTARLMLSQMLAADSQSYLMKNMSFQRGLVYSMGAHTDEYPGGFEQVITASVAPDKAQRALSTLASLMMKLPERLSRADFQRIKRAYSFRIASVVETPENWAERAISDVERYGHVRSLTEIRHEYVRLEFAQVQQAAKALVAQPPFVAALGDVEKIRINEPFELAFEKHGGPAAKQWLAQADAQRDKKKVASAPA
jgi:predicted Zn-dependent peptidase